MMMMMMMMMMMTMKMVMMMMMMMMMMMGKDPAAPEMCTTLNCRITFDELCLWTTFLFFAIANI